MNILVRKTGKSPVYRMGKVDYIPLDWQKVVKIIKDNCPEPLMYRKSNGKMDGMNKFQMSWTGKILTGKPYKFTPAEKQIIIKLEVRERLEKNDLLTDILIDKKDFSDMKEKVLELKQEIDDNFDNIKYKHIFREELINGSAINRTN